LTKKERYYIDSIDCINKIIPGRTDKEYYSDNKEKIKQYYSDNKEKIREKQSVTTTCSKCGSVVLKRGLLRHQRSLKCQNTADILLELDEIN
jgi:ribosomal protein S27AE